MCLTCGCMQPDNAHGDTRNITRSDLVAATKTEAAGGISPDQAVKNFNKTVAKDRTSHEALYETASKVTSS